ncbi:hypothetical protein BC834DRAFT_885670 [Gloeopeniophorella convolvens]|nr:hypothetical protein BC834DRAFT_885670 [Gloeopeniophorella convolvens]
MRPFTNAAALILAAYVAAPVLAVPLPAREVEARELEERSILSLLKPLAVGILGGVAPEILQKLTGSSSSSSSSSKRELEEFIERSLVGSLLGATEDALPTVLKNAAAGGLATGAVVTAGHEIENLFGGNNNRRELEERISLSTVTDILKPLGVGVLGALAPTLIQKFTGSGSSSSKREVDELITRSLIGSLLGATEDALPTVLKNAAAGGLATGAVVTAGDEIEKLFGKGSRRDLDVREPLSPIIKGLIGTVTSLAASSGLEHLFGGSNNRRDLT